MVLSLIRTIKNKIGNFRKQQSLRQEAPPSEAPAKRRRRTESTPATPPVTEVPVEAEADADVKKRRPRRRRKKKGPAEAEVLLADAAPEAGPDEPALAEEPWELSLFDVPVAEGKTRFHDMDLPLPLLRAIADLGFQYCSPIQAAIMPATLAGRDASGQAQTGTGKTAAFLITILTHLFRNPREDRKPGMPRALILAPTRELVIQISEEASLLAKYLPSRIVSVFGGMDYQKQLRQLTGGPVDIIVATPGRMIDFCQHDDVRLDAVEILVLDEADRMLDMGFLPQVRQLVRKTPYKDKRQTLLFSATMIGEVERMASNWTVDPITVEIAPEHVESDSVEQLIYLITVREKFALLYNLITRQDLKRVIIFCNRRDETQRLATKLEQYGISCSVISGDIPQKKRLSTLEDFRSGQLRVLVATDVAGRGIHVEGISHVINYTLPHEAENYVHRIGRTGRAGATGTSVSFACEDDSFYIPAIEEFLGHSLVCVQPESEWLQLPPPPAGKAAGPRSPSSAPSSSSRRPPGRRRPEGGDRGKRRENR